MDEILTKGSGTQAPRCVRKRKNSAFQFRISMALLRFGLIVSRTGRKSLAMRNLLRLLQVSYSTVSFAYYIAKIGTDLEQMNEGSDFGSR